MKVKEKVIENVKYLREKCGITTERLSIMIGKNKKFIYNLEHGKRIISADLIDRLAKALNINSTDLINKTKNEIKFLK